MWIARHRTDAGVRSGISVQNPNRQGAVPGGNLVQDLLRRAAEYVSDSCADAVLSDRYASFMMQSGPSFCSSRIRFFHS